MQQQPQVWLFLQPRRFELLELYENSTMLSIYSSCVKYRKPIMMCQLTILYVLEDIRRL